MWLVAAISAASCNQYVVRQGVQYFLYSVFSAICSDSGEFK